MEFDEIILEEVSNVLEYNVFECSDPLIGDGINM